LAITLPAGPVGSISPLAEFNLCDMMAAKEIPMKKHFLMLTTAASILACGTAGASAQEDTDNPVMQQLEQAQQDPTDEVNPDASGHSMMRRCMRQCLSGDSMMGRHTMRPGGMRGGFAMRIIFALMDPDGDGTISLEEFQAAHERIFKAMDADKDGTVSMEEMRDFLHGAGKATLPQRSAPKD
jgi:EF hand